METGRGETNPPESRWWQALPPAEATIQCGEREHVLRWADGALTLPAHPDAEAELVLGALGGQSAACVEAAGMWGRHSDDLDVLALGPRSAVDRVTITRDELGWARAHVLPAPGGPAGPPPGAAGSGAQQAYQSRLITTLIGTAGVRASVSPFGTAAAGSPGQIAGPAFVFQASPDPDTRRSRVSRIELLSLFALGPPFQMRLTGAVAASLDGQTRAANRPRLAAALTGRLAPAAGEWLGIDPDRVTAAVHEGPGWGSLELTGTGEGRGLRASLPLSWLARVWACGLAVAGGHLVVAVRAARWPDAEVLALPEPGTEPVVLRLRGSLPDGEAHDGPRWAILSQPETHPTAPAQPDTPPAATGTGEEAAAP
ncbi:MAG TPA: hypothetical protein VKS82_00220 [Streptosporangiaceae bacterium]|nr:hypothetical protein [Streptosporangiaceae bacterium]